MTLTNQPRERLPVPAPSPLSQSRELGDVLPEKDGLAVKQKSPFAKSWPHMVAGGYALVPFPILPPTGEPPKGEETNNNIFPAVSEA